jgi:hypothetical protein
MDPGYPEVLLCHLLDGGAFSLTQHDAEQPDKHPPASAWFGSDASCLRTTSRFSANNNRRGEGRIALNGKVIYFHSYYGVALLR